MSNLKWSIWFAWWIIFCFRRSRLIEFIINKHASSTENPPVQIYTNKIKNRILFKIKTGYKSELLSLKTLKLWRSAKKDVDQDKGGEDVPKLETVEVVLVHCNLVNTNYKQASKVLFIFVPNKQFGQVITTASHSLTIPNTTTTELLSTEVWFNDQNSKHHGYGNKNRKKYCKNCF